MSAKSCAPRDANRHFERAIRTGDFVQAGGASAGLATSWESAPLILSLFWAAPRWRRPPPPSPAPGLQEPASFSAGAMPASFARARGARAAETSAQTARRRALLQLHAAMLKW